MKEEPVLSVHPEYATAIFSGTKSVEFRRRALRVPESGRVWIYATRPIGGIMGCIDVDTVVCSSPAHLWRRYGRLGKIDRESFDRYFAGCETGYALVVGSTRPLNSVLHLDEIRAVCPGFTPPQFYLRRLPGALAALIELARRAATSSC